VKRTPYLCTMRTALVALLLLQTSVSATEYSVPISVDGSVICDFLFRWLEALMNCSFSQRANTGARLELW
jgi:hypothetical protein